MINTSIIIYYIYKDVLSTSNMNINDIIFLFKKVELNVGELYN